MEKKYRIELSVEERQELKAMVSRGRAAAYRQTHARILLLSDEAQGDGVMKDGDIARSLQVGRGDGGKGTPPLCGGGCGGGLGTPGATQSPSEEVGRSGGSPPGCPGLRRTATGPGKLDA